ncbi:uncharacterized protein LOC106673854 [Cimex lectularius]|uniref:Uncharacterized protein n=1 Tax=Cimex lectularius TaxID=79782 RepID=A0A8I6SSF1_CIMLE|nr:uncharacterized protein LOC106673854 [Cimex lectularius]
MWRTILKAAAVTICAAGAYQVYRHFKREIIEIPEYYERQELEKKRDIASHRKVRGKTDQYIFTNISDEESDEEESNPIMTNNSQEENDAPSTSQENRTEPPTEEELLTMKIINEIIRTKPWLLEEENPFSTGDSNNENSDDPPRPSGT